MSHFHRYSPEEHQFLQSFIPGHTYKEIVAAYNARFEDQITEGRVKGYMANHKIKNGLTGRFKKGHQAHNKGKKGCYAPGSEKGWFQKGHTPKNHRPVGSERVNADGYIEIKIAEPNKWRCKHRVVWEEANGPIPEGYVVAFLDSDKLNCSLDNLRLVSRAALVRINQNKLLSDNPEISNAGISLGELMAVTGKRKKQKGKI